MKHVRRFRDQTSNEDFMANIRIFSIISEIVGRNK